MEKKLITPSAKANFSVNLIMAHHIAKETPRMSDCSRKWMTISQVADMLQLSEDYVRSLIQKGHIRAVKLPGSRNAPVRVAKDDILEFLESCNITDQETFNAKNMSILKKNAQRRRRRSASAASWGV